MKKLAVALVLLNGALFLYWRYISPTPSTTTANATALTPAPPRILLATERPEPVAECRSLGPLPNRKLLAQVTEWMGGRFGALNEREAAIPAPPVYRVQLTTPSADQAARIAQRYRAAGLGDVAVLAPEPGETTVLVAMGQFTERSNADRRVLELKRHAVEASVAMIERHASQWWLDFTSLETLDLAELLHALPAAHDAAVAPCEIALPGEEAPSTTTPTPPTDSRGVPAPKLGGVRSSGAAA